MNNWNLDGKAQETREKVYISEMEDGEPKVYVGKITSISDVYTQKKYGSEDEEEKITMNVLLDPEFEVGEIPFFLNFKVMKGSGSYSNSKLYDVLEVAGLVEEAKEVAGKMYPEKLNFLNKHLVGKKVKFLAKTVNKGKENQYSVVDRFTKVWDATKAIEEKVE